MHLFSNKEELDHGFLQMDKTTDCSNKPIIECKIPERKYCKVPESIDLPCSSYLFIFREEYTVITATSVATAIGHLESIKQEWSEDYYVVVHLTNDPHWNEAIDNTKRNNLINQIRFLLFE